MESRPPNLKGFLKFFFGTFFGPFFRCEINSQSVTISQMLPTFRFRTEVNPRNILAADRIRE